MMAAVSALMVALTAVAMIVLDRLYGLDRCWWGSMMSAAIADPAAPHRREAPREPSPSRSTATPAARCDGDTVLTAVLTQGAAAAPQRFQRRAARRLLPDGRLPGLLGRHSTTASGCAPARRSSAPGMALVTRRSGGMSEAASSRVIVGAGPAGIRAAQTLVAHGLRPVVIDEARPRRRPDLSPPAGATSRAAARRSTASRPARATARASTPSTALRDRSRLPARQRWSGTREDGRLDVLHGRRRPRSRALRRA